MRFHRDGSGTPPSGGYFEGVTVSNVTVSGRPCVYQPVLVQLEELCVNDNLIMGELAEERQ